MAAHLHGLDITFLLKEVQEVYDMLIRPDLSYVHVVAYTLMTEDKCRPDLLWLANVWWRLDVSYRRILQKTLSGTYHDWRWMSSTMRGHIVLSASIRATGISALAVTDTEWPNDMSPEELLQIEDDDLIRLERGELLTPSFLALNRSGADLEKYAKIPAVAMLCFSTVQVHELLVCNPHAVLSASLPLIVFTMCLYWTDLTSDHLDVIEDAIRKSPLHSSELWMRTNLHPGVRHIQSVCEWLQSFDRCDVTLLLGTILRSPSTDRELVERLRHYPHDPSFLPPSTLSSNS